MRKVHVLRRLTATTLVAAMLFVTVGSSGGCLRQQFDVGTGATGDEKREYRQWFVLWGLVPITEVQDKAEDYAAGAANYTVSSEITLIDGIIGIFTGIVSIVPKTMIVEK